MDVLLGLCDPNLADFVFLLQVYDQLVLPLNYVSIFFDCFDSVVKPSFKVFNFLSLYLVQHFQLLVERYQLVLLHQVELG